jgi:sulfate adenylyltransferase
MLKTGKTIPAWFTYPEVHDILKCAYPPRNKQGFTIVISGTSDNLSMIAAAMATCLNQGGERQPTIIGDLKDIDYISFVASNVSKNGGAVIIPMNVKSKDLGCEKVRRAVEEANGGFILVSVNQNETEFNGKADICISDKASISQIVGEVILELEKEAFIGSR